MNGRMSTIAAPTTPLAPRLLPLTGPARIALLVVGGALLTAACAQVSVTLPFTPVPITGQTFAVLLVGLGSGMTIGASSQALYVVLGAVGLPFYAGGDSGWEVATGATSGYLVGFVIAAALVGRLAEMGQDRNVITSIPAVLTGTVVIYVSGCIGLMIVVGYSLAEAVEKGVAPFLIGDAIKILLVGAALPLAWKLVGDPSGEPD